MTEARDWHTMMALINRARFRHARRHRLFGSWAHPLVVEAMYLTKALHEALRATES